MARKIDGEKVSVLPKGGHKVSNTIFLRAIFPREDAKGNYRPSTLAGNYWCDCPKKKHKEE